MIGFIFFFSSHFRKVVRTMFKKLLRIEVSSLYRSAAGRPGQNSPGLASAAVNVMRAANSFLFAI